MRLHVHEYGDPAGFSADLPARGHAVHGERFRRLAEERLEGRRVIALDLRGHGRSGSEPPWSLDAHVGDALETATALGVQEADWLGFSYGGRVAAALAAREPERVESLVLLDPALHLPRVLPRAGARRARATSPSRTSTRRSRTGLPASPHAAGDARGGDEPASGRGEDGRLRYRYEPVAAIATWSDMAAAPPPVADVRTLIVRGDQSVGARRSRSLPGRTTLEVAGGHPVLWRTSTPPRPR